MGIPPRYAIKQTQPCIFPRSQNRVPALIGWVKAGCHLCHVAGNIWHVSFYSGEARCMLLYRLLYFYFMFLRQVEDHILDSLQLAVKTKYAGPSALNPASLLLNVIMLQVCTYSSAKRETWPIVYPSVDVGTNLYIQGHLKGRNGNCAYSQASPVDGFASNLA